MRAARVPRTARHGSGRILENFYRHYIQRIRRRPSCFILVGLETLLEYQAALVDQGPAPNLGPFAFGKREARSIESRRHLEC